MRRFISVCSAAVIVCLCGVFFCGGCTRATRAQAWIDKGVELSNLGRHEEALQACDRAIKIDPNSAEAWFLTGAALFGLSRYEEAIQAYEQTSKLAPDNLAAWYGKCRALGNLGRYKEAIRACEEVLKIDPLAIDLCWQCKSAFFAEMVGSSSHARRVLEDPRRDGH